MDSHLRLPPVMPSVLIVQPTLKHYRLRVYEALARTFDVHVAASEFDREADESCRCRFLRAPLVHLPLGFKWQKGLKSAIERHRIETVWMAADLHYLSSVLLTFWCRWKGVKVVLHGQGLVKQGKSRKARAILLEAWARAAHLYASYGDASSHSLLRAGFPENRLRTLRNRFELPLPIPAFQLHEEARDLLFVGRLRKGCGIEDLVKQVAELNEEGGPAIHLHVVGEGEEGASLAESARLYPWLKLHGRLTDPRSLEEIAKRCAIGVYPGKAGLSVLTYMGLGLGVIVGDDLEKHMGPEPAYVADEETGWTFRSGDLDALKATIRSALSDPALVRIRRKARRFYEEIHQQSYGEEMAAILSSTLKRAS